MTTKRKVFFVSDRTGITAETLGHSLLTQFDELETKQMTIPFVDSVKKAQHAVEMINQVTEQDGIAPLVFSTLVDEELSEIVKRSNGITYDFFNAFIAPMEQELDMKSCHTIGRSHGLHNTKSYYERIEGINFSLSSDDGLMTKCYEDADIILTGVSRSGKTPTSMYISIQYGFKVANYPLIDQDLGEYVLPEAIQPYKDKLFGLIINAETLSQIRSERRPNSKYASILQCQHEVHTSEMMFRYEGIPMLDTSSVSIEEIATIIIDKLHLKRRLYGY